MIVLLELSHDVRLYSVLDTVVIGFRTFMSLSAVVQCVDVLSRFVFLDLKIAFETIDHAILLRTY